MQSRPRLLALAVVLAAAVAIGVVPTGPAAGAPGGDRKHELQAQIGEASQRESAAIAALQDIQDRKRVVDARVAELDAQVSAAQAKLAPLEAEAQRLTARYTELQAQVAATQAELDAARLEFKKSAASLYRSARRGATFDVVLAARPDTMVKQDKYLDRVSAERRAIVERVAELRAELEQQRRSLEAEKAKADQAAAEAQAIRDQVASLRAEVEPERADAATQESAEQSAIDGIQAQKSDFEGELASLQAASDGIAARLRAMGSGPGSPGSCGARPVPGAIVSPFGPRFHPILHYTRLHSGADMSAGSGTPIHSCRAGSIVIAGSQGGYGNAVVIDHGGNMATLYAHQSRIAVEVGQHVEAGEVIGYVGSTGMSTGPHLHFEVRLSGNPVDPASYL
jgi:murein DD-endopeptidase MepM/ murein hydrolase activator NlpD